MIQEKLVNQKAYFHEGKTQSVRFRLGQLQKLRDGIKKYESQLLEALFVDLGKSKFEAYTNEVGFVLDSIKYAMKNLKDWSRIDKVKLPIHHFGAKGEIHYEPYGSVLIIGPFNYPFQLLIEPMIGALAAGNTVILKPSSDTPHVEALVVKMMKELFKPEYVDVVTGDRQVVTELIHSPFDYMFFTGSVNVGKIVMKAASENLVPVTLELGGKSPTIVDKSAHIDLAAKRIAWGKFINAGQTCVAPDYVYVHESIADKFKLRVMHYIRKFYGENPQLSPDYGRIVSERHFNRLLSLIDEEKKCFGGRHDIDEKYIEPTVLEHVTWDDPVMEDEIFGPIMPIMTYSDLNQVIHEINSRPKPLALYVFASRKKVVKEVIKRTSSGGVGVNETIIQVASHKLPFGGVGHSGMGSYHGKYSFETFSHKKSIVKKGNIGLDVVYPPYKNKFTLGKMILK